MKTFTRSILTTLALIAFSSASPNDADIPEISGTARVKVALQSLKSEPNTIQVYTKGLVCESCAIGIRKKLQRLDFVDTAKPDKGIVLKVKSQLISISVKDGKAFDPASITKAVKGAGYEAVTLYQLDSGKKLKSTSL